MIYLRKISEEFRSSLWMLPTALCLAGITLALCTIILDYSIGERFAPAQTREESFKATVTLLTTVAAALVAITGFLFSALIALLGRAAIQYGPSVTRLYRTSSFAKLGPGTLIGTISYLFTLLTCILLVHSFPRPYVSLALGGILVTATLIILPLFIHRVAIMLEPGHLAMAIAQQLDDSLRRLEKLEQKSEEESSKNGNTNTDIADIEWKYSVTAPYSGYIQAIDRLALVKIASRNGIHIAVRQREGNFVSGGVLLVHYDGNKKLDEESEKRIANQFVIGTTRTPTHDLECTVEYLVGVVVRALSPGVNDLFTAMRGIDYLSASCGLLLHRKLSSGQYDDEEGELRVIAKEFDFSGFLTAAWFPIRQNTNNQIAVIVRAMDGLHRLIKLKPVEERMRAILHIAEQFSEVGKKQAHVEDDRRTIQERIQQIREDAGMAPPRQ